MATRGRLIARGSAVAALVIGVAACAATMALHRWQPDVAEYPIQGIDVGAANGVIDWLELRGARVDFAYLTATQGHRRDPQFSINWSESEAAGLRRGAVLDWSLCAPADQQATAFIATVPRERAALPSAIGFDFGHDCAARPARSQLVADVRRVIAMVEAHMGKPVLLRISRSFEDDYALSRAIDRTLWVTGSLFRPEYAARPWVMWRANDWRRVPGIDGPVNWDVVAP